ncbi:hypothetical protein PH552_26240 [Rhizobium sp. CNPSo 3968]|uniref:phosphoketolase family protein n=1 Tax=Rhizobium sp. CNPSo 3968 TaxID=3021408 RepID=UPI00254F7F69|nr:hypothetical protein [Rhizobium sp. CNPSo 3968]MDK4722861.1 hypothetical protein [Rhizobium sp. CNPSo 3968]
MRPCRFEFDSVLADLQSELAKRSALRKCARIVVIACAGDVPTMKTMSAADVLRQNALELWVWVVDVV